MRKTTQKERLLITLIANREKGVTIWDAMTDLGIGCLHKRIAELEQLGAVIEHRDESKKNRWGTTSTITRYVLTGGDIPKILAIVRKEAA